MAIQPVDLEKFYRLVNHGPTAMISAKADGVENIMSAAWVCALDFAPKAKMMIVVDKQTFTRTLIEKSGLFTVQIPTAAQAELVIKMGESRYQNADKIANVERFYQAGFDVPLVSGCAGWIVCKLINEPHNQMEHDLFIGEVQAAWADDRIFENGHWKFDEAPDELKTLHYVAGGQFYRIGKGLTVEKGLDTP